MQPRRASRIDFIDTVPELLWAPFWAPMLAAIVNPMRQILRLPPSHSAPSTGVACFERQPSAPPVSSSRDPYAVSPIRRARRQPAPHPAPFCSQPDARTCFSPDAAATRCPRREPLQTREAPATPAPAAHLRFSSRLARSCACMETRVRPDLRPDVKAHSRCLDASPPSLCSGVLPLHRIPSPATQRTWICCVTVLDPDPRHDSLQQARPDPIGDPLQHFDPLRSPTRLDD